MLNFKYVQPDVDVWATTFTLYYMVTGNYTRDFAHQDPFLSILQSQPVPIRQRNALIPQPLANLIDLALQDYPQLYFKNALAFKNALLSVVLKLEQNVSDALINATSNSSAYIHHQS